MQKSRELEIPLLLAVTQIKHLSVLALSSYNGLQTAPPLLVFQNSTGSPVHIHAYRNLL
jgi:hypothetical protein